MGRMRGCRGGVECDEFQDAGTFEIPKGGQVRDLRSLGKAVIALSVRDFGVSVRTSFGEVVPRLGFIEKPEGPELLSQGQRGKLAPVKPSALGFNWDTALGEIIGGKFGRARVAQCLPNDVDRFFAMMNPNGRQLHFSPPQPPWHRGILVSRPLRLESASATGEGIWNLFVT